MRIKYLLITLIFFSNVFTVNAKNYKFINRIIQYCHENKSKNYISFREFNKKSNIDVFVYCTDSSRRNLTFIITSKIYIINSITGKIVDINRKPLKHIYVFTNNTFYIYSNIDKSSCKHKISAPTYCDSVCPNPVHFNKCITNQRYDATKMKKYLLKNNDINHQDLFFLEESFQLDLRFYYTHFTHKVLYQRRIKGNGTLSLDPYYLIDEIPNVRL